MEYAAWIEAISTAVAALAAVIAGYFAYKAYQKDRSEIQDQLNSLKVLADHQGKENEFLQRQLGLNTELVNIENRKRKTDIMPLIQGGSGGGNYQNYEIGLQNNGGIAYNFDVIEIENEYLVIKGGKSQREIRSGAKCSIYVTVKQGIVGKSPHNCESKLELRYEDIDGNRYRQEIVNDGRGFILQKAIEIV